MTENKNQNQNFGDILQEEEDFEEELFDIEEEDSGEEEYTSGEEDNSEAMPKEENRDYLDDNSERIKEESESSKEEDAGLLDKKEEQDYLNSSSKDDKIYFSKSKLLLAQKLIKNIKENNDKLLDILGESITEDGPEAEMSEQAQEPFSLTEEETDEGKIIEGVFDGLNMIGPDGQSYTVPANYASKSKLVEGDVLKLTITSSGGFIYKQIHLVERKRVVGILQKTKEGDYVAHAKGKIWKLLPAGVTYFKGEPGDEVIFLIPQKAQSRWGAVENIIKK
jgi:hypothetical protein